MPQLLIKIKLIPYSCELQLTIL